jgi:hypothetical protein
MMEEIIQQDIEDSKPDLGPESRPETPQSLEKLVKHCLDLFSLFEGSEYRAGKLKELKEAREVYDQIEQKTDFPFKNASNQTLPLTAITVDNTEPRFVAALVGKDPIVNFTMEGMETKDPGLLIVEDFFNKELKHVARIENYTMTHIHQLLNEGTVFAIPQYCLEERVVRDYVFDQQGNVVMKMEDIPVPVMDPNTRMPAIHPMTGQPLMQVIQKPTGEPEMADQTIIEREGGKVEIVPFKDMFYADDLGTIEEWETADKIRRVNPTYAELMTKKGEMGYQNIGPWLLTEKGGKEKLTDDEAVVTGKETIECVECHVTYPINRDETKEEKEQVDFTEEKIIVTIAVKSQTIVRLVLNRDLLWSNTSIIKRCRLYPENGKSCGTPIYGKLKAVQNGCSDMFNAVINIAYVTMIPWFFHDQRAGLKGEVDLYPGKGVGVDNVQGILIPQFRINPNQYIDFVNLFMSMWERIGNISDWNMGITNQQGGKKTASEVLAVIQEGNISHNYRANTVRDEYILIIKTLYDLYYQHMPLDKTFVYEGKQVKIPRKLMKRDYKFNLSGSTDAANKMIERKTSDDLLMMFGQDPLINPLKPRENVLKNYGVQDTTEWIMPQAGQLIQALMGNPEIIQVVGKYLQDKAQIGAAVQGPQGGQGGPKRPGAGEGSPGPGSLPQRVMAGMDAAAQGGV